VVVVVAVVKNGQAEFVPIVPSLVSIVPAPLLVQMRPSFLERLLREFSSMVLAEKYDSHTHGDLEISGRMMLWVTVPRKRMPGQAIIQNPPG
jgi:hypothetical protein